MLIGTHDNPTAIEWWSNVASKEEKEKFIEYIRRPFSSSNEFIDGLKLEEHISKYISWYFIQIVLQSSANGAILLMQDLLNIQIRMNYPGKGLQLQWIRK
jgi:4-alpha-glucanotransferase